MYEQVERAWPVAEKFGVSTETIYRVLRNHGIPRTHRHQKQPTKQSTGRKCKRWDDSITEECANLYNQGMTCDEIGKRFGYNWHTVLRHLKQHGVTIRNVGARRSNLEPLERREVKLARDKKRRDAISLRPHDGPAHGLKWQDIAKRDHMRCKICGRKVNASDKWLSEHGRWCFGRTYPTIDHIIPLANGGTDTYGNVQLTCKRCNSKKQHKGQMRLAI